VSNPPGPPGPKFSKGITGAVSKQTRNETRATSSPRCLEHRSWFACKMVAAERQRAAVAPIKHLKRLTNLRRLWLINTQVTHNGAEKLRQALPECRIDYYP